MEAQKKKKRKVVIANDMAVGVVLVAESASLVCDTRNQKLGKSYNGIPTYKAVNEAGVPTGHGSAFEDLVRDQMRNAGMNAKLMPEEKNGPDIKVGNQNYQLKCCKDAKSIVSSLVDEKGNYRYPGQALVVPTESRQGVEEDFANRKVDGFVVPENIIGCSSRKEAKQFAERGIRSLYMDFKRPNNQMIVGGAMIAATALAYNKERLRSKEEKTDFSKLRFFKNAVIYNAGVFLAESLVLAYRQSRRA